MNLKNGLGLPECSGEFSGYSGHVNKSSELSLLSKGGILKKKKKRAMGKSVHELLAISLWQRVLEHYQHIDINIISPSPYGVDDEGSIFMEFLEGSSTDIFIKENNIQGNYYDLAKRFGRLFRIKEIEQIGHKDFDLRHLLYNTNDKILGVIDLEKSRKVSMNYINNEHQFIVKQFLDLIDNDLTSILGVKKGLEEGYYSLTNSEPVLGEISNIVKKELNFSFNEIERFLKPECLY